MTKKETVESDKAAVSEKLSVKSKTAEESENLSAELTAAVKDLLYLSETDAPFEVFVWQPETGAAAFSDVNAADVLRLSENSADASIREQSPDDFFRVPTTVEEWHTDEDKIVVNRFVELKELLTKNLRDLKIFKIGSVELKVYIIGIDAEGNLSGVKTEAVET